MDILVVKTGKTNLIMKTLQLILTLMIFVGSINAQNQYYDALEIKNNIVDNELFMDDSILVILKHYYPSIKSISDTAKINKVIRDSLLLGDIKISFVESKEWAPKHIDYKNVISKIGGIDVTTFTQGLSLFLIERAKEELNVAFFQRFKDFFEAEEHEEIRTLFPVTAEKIGGLLAYQYPQMLPVLQDAFHRDMNELPENIINVLLLPKNLSETEKHPEFLILINLYKILDQFNYLSPPQLLEKLPTMAQFDRPQLDTLISIKNIYMVLKLTEILSNSVLKQSSLFDDNTNYWISSTDFNQHILRDTVAKKIFLGLLYQQILKDHLEINGEPIANSLKKEKTEQDINWFCSLLSKALQQFEKIDFHAAKIHNAAKNGIQPGTDDYLGYSNNVLRLTEISLEAAQHVSASISSHYIWLIKNGHELFSNIYSKEYSLAINNAITLLETLNQIIKNKSNSKDKKNDKSLINPEVMTGIITYGRFIGNVAAAENPEEVKTAISAIALPSGSSSVKKYQQNNISINAYLGATAMLYSDDASTSKTWTNTVGMTAPIGLNWAFGSLRKGGSLSLFTSLFDIGAVVDYQLTDSTKSSFEQRIYLENILSPGAYFVYGLWGNIPMAISIGGQYGPGLTKIGNGLKEPSWRWNVTLTVDIPMVNLNQGRRR